MALINWKLAPLSPQLHPVAVSIPPPVEIKEETNDAAPQIKQEPVSEDEAPVKIETTEVHVKNEEDTEETHVVKKRRGKKQTCPHCAYATTWKGNLRKHIVSRHTAAQEIQWLQCEHCPYKGKTKDYLKCHLIHVHNIAVKWYNCTQCSFKAKLKSHLDRHVIVNHTDVEQIQWFECDQCSYKAKFKTNLKNHRLSQHTRESDIKWYKCEFCDFKAKWKRNLKFHLLNKHTEEDKINWFYCHFCESKFKRKQALKGHVETVHESEGAKGRKMKPKTKEIPVFIDNKLCWRRVVVADEEWPEESVLKCDECAFETTDKGLFRKHMLKLHTITEIEQDNDDIIRKTYKTKNVIVFVDNVPVVKKVIEHSLSQ